MPKGLRPITTYHLFNSETITKNTAKSSVAVDLREVAQDGIFSIEYCITGSGTAKIEYNLCSIKAGTYIEPTSGLDIASGLTSSSGTSGRDIVTFNPELAPFMKIKVTETGTAADVVVDLKLNIQ